MMTRLMVLSDILLAGLRRASIAAALAIALGTGGEAVAVPSVLSFGRNYHGQTGQGFDGDSSTVVATPIDVTNLAGYTITQVAAGTDHNLLLADDGSVFSFGFNYFGRTGLNTTDFTATPTAMPIDTTNLAGKIITQVAAGDQHSLLLASDGTVFSFGFNDSGRTGVNTPDIYTPIATPIDATNLAGKTITQVAAGGGHSLLLADDGTVFSFGYNGFGGTGQNTLSGETPIATPIDATNLAGKKITQVAAGDYHNLLLADDGTVFSFGANLEGETGLNTTDGFTRVATPIDATNLAGKKITQVAAAYPYSLLLADDGTVFSFGDNQHGATGQNTLIGNTPIATPIDATNLASHVITQISAGGNSLLLASDGTVFSFGMNWAGQAGLGFVSDDPLPVATPIDTTNLTGSRARVVGLSAGGTHNLLLAVPEPTSGVIVMTLGICTVGRPRYRRSKPLQMAGH